MPHFPDDIEYSEKY